MYVCMYVCMCNSHEYNNLCTYLYIYMIMYDYDLRFIFVSCCFLLDMDETFFFVWIAMKSWNTRQDDFDVWALLAVCSIWSECNHTVLPCVEIFWGARLLFPDKTSTSTTCSSEKAAKVLTQLTQLRQLRRQGRCWSLWLHTPWGSPFVALVQTVTR